MNRIEHLINYPYEVDTDDIDLLNAEIEKYPYFYSLHALKSLALKKANNEDLEKQLEITATISNNKGLFDLIYSSGNNLKVEKNLNLIIEEPEVINLEETILIDNEIQSNEEELIINNSDDYLEVDNLDNTEDFESLENEIIIKDLEINEEITNEFDSEKEDKDDDLINFQIQNAIENSIQVTEEITTNNEIISQAVEETKDVVLDYEILKDLEQVNLVNRSQDIISIDENSNQTPISVPSAFIILNSKDDIVRGSSIEIENKHLDQSSFISEDTENFEEIVNEEIVNEEVSLNTDAFSFNDWLKIQSSNVTDHQKEQKFQIIEDFLEKNPKITPLKKQEIPESKTEAKSLKQSDFSDLMTETLAQIYIEQKQYEKAIKAYKILILKYPEKNSLFANQIKEIENLKNSK